MRSARRLRARCCCTRTAPGLRPTMLATSSTFRPPTTRSRTISAWWSGSMARMSATASSPSTAADGSTPELRCSGAPAARSAGAMGTAGLRRNVRR